MDLILWRHCEAEPETGGDDLARRLTSKGQRQAKRMASWLSQRLPDQVRILVSPAERTQQTAMALGRKFHVVDDIAPGASAEAVLAAADWPDARNAVVVVGHQPTLGDVVARLLADSDGGWSVKKGAIIWLASHSRERDAAVLLKAAVSPDIV